LVQLFDESEADADNGIRIVAMGNHIRAYGPNDVPSATPVPYYDKDGNDTGIQYAIGNDRRLGETKIAWVDYPVPPFTLEDIQNSPHVAGFFKRCNSCAAAEVVKKELARQGSVPVQHHMAPQMMSSPPPVRRVSLGDIGLPMYIPVVLDLLKSIWLSRLGDLGASTVISAVSDVLSGTLSDPAQQQALRNFSDQQMEGVASKIVDERYIDEIKSDFGRLVDAYRKDGDILDAILHSAVKPVDTVLKEAGVPVQESSKSRQPARRTELRSYRTLD